MRATWMRNCLLALLLLSCTACLGPFPDRFGAKQTQYLHLSSWPYERHGEALKAFLKGCPQRLKAGSSASKSGLYVSAAQWQMLCDQAKLVVTRNSGAKGRNLDVAAQEYFENYFTPFTILNRGGEDGLFTGYYEPMLYGSYKKTARYRYPVYAAPKDQKKGVAYFSHAEINAGALKGKRLELLYVDDPVMLFFLQIQGSGRVKMSNGKTLRIGYAGKNGHGYVPIGRVMKEEGLLPEDGVTFFSIRQWLYDNPDKAQAMMEENPSYVFFKILHGDGPIGGSGSVLTPQRSLAVDTGYIPYNLPVYLQTQLPATELTGGVQLYHQLMVAQDTGGAIRGPIRGDIFFGPGPVAEALAGNMNGEGGYILLVPNAVAAQWNPPQE